MEERGSWKNYKRVSVESSWFWVYDLGDEVYAIYEPYHFQEVISYLIIGEVKALLWDTGMGIENIQQVVEELTERPVTVLNSHVHFDHVGDDHRFETVRVFDQAGAVARLKRGYSREEMRPHASKTLFAEDSFEKLSRDWSQFHIPPCQPVTVKDGESIDLGGRLLEVIHTPGHSPESIMLLDRGKGLLFSGDTYYPGHLYAHFSGDVYQDSDMVQYAASMEKVSLLEPLLKAVHPSHNEPGCPPEVLGKTAEALVAIAEGRAEDCCRPLADFSLASLPEDGAQLAGYPPSDRLYVYHFDHANIICRKEEKP